MIGVGTVITKEDYIKAVELLNKSYPQQMIFSSVIDFESDYSKERELIAKDYERIKYLEMWKKVKREFPFVNKM